MLQTPSASGFGVGFGYLNTEPHSGLFGALGFGNLGMDRHWFGNLIVWLISFLGSLMCMVILYDFVEGPKRRPKREFRNPAVFRWVFRKGIHRLKVLGKKSRLVVWFKKIQNSLMIPWNMCFKHIPYTYNKNPTFHHVHSPISQVVWLGARGAPERRGYEKESLAGVRFRFFDVTFGIQAGKKRSSLISLAHSLGLVLVDSKNHKKVVVCIYIYIFVFVYIYILQLFWGCHFPFGEGVQPLLATHWSHCCCQNALQNSTGAVNSLLDKKLCLKRWMFCETKGKTPTVSEAESWSANCFYFFEDQPPCANPSLFGWFCFN